MAAAALGNANVTFQTGNAPAATDENLLFDAGQVGTSVLASTNQSHFDYAIAPTESLTTSGNSQATLTGTDGFFNTVTVSPLMGTTMTGASFGATGPKNAVITLSVDGGASSQAFTLSSTGNPMFSIVATGGSTFSSFTISSTSDLDTLKQVRVGGVQAVPEPASMAALGLGAAGFVRRRRKG